MPSLFHPEVLMLIMAGSSLGYLFGILPGLDGLIALALFAPLGLYLNADVAFYFYAAMLGAATFAGSVPAILFRIPGTPFSLVTCFDGFEMSRKGRGMEALAISAVASAMGALISAVFLILSLPIARQIVMLFGPAEKFWLVVCAFIMVPFLSGEDWLKGLVSVSLGVVLASIGRSVVTGQIRYTFGTTYLTGGLGIIPFLAIGVFAISVILRMTSTPRQAIAFSSAKLDFRQVWTGTLFVFRKPLALIRGAMLGALVGAIPGLGGVTASFLSYLSARASSKTPEKFGKGIPDGVLAPEASNNGVQGGAAITSLLLGIPGSLEWAVVLGIMVMYGIMPGPTLLTEHPSVVWGIIWGIVLANVIASSIGLLAGTQLSRLTSIKPLYIVPVVFVTCMVGANLISNSVWDCVIALIGGLFGYFIHKLNYELLPFALGFILGPFIEKNFYLAFQVGYHTFSGFFSSVTSIILIMACVLVLVIGPRVRRRLMRGVPA
ncbi:MAG: tripartite tricarboxylate transporter permease [Deltaproteobacteria bacterium]|nr:MAG: tripartite tricarboxylate transporter permease [Deltaproteobacteria bacterium]